MCQAIRASFSDTSCYENDRLIYGFISQQLFKGVVKNVVLIGFRVYTVREVCTYNA